MKYFPTQHEKQLFLEELEDEESLGKMKTLQEQIINLLIKRED